MPGAAEAPPRTFPSHTSCEPAGPRTLATRRPDRSNTAMVAVAPLTMGEVSANWPEVGLGPSGSVGGTASADTARWGPGGMGLTTVNSAMIWSLPPLSWGQVLVVTWNFT